MKAIVMETRGNKAAILLKDGTFRTVRGRYTVGETIEYRETLQPAIRKWIASAAAAVILIGAGGGSWYDANYVAYAEISLDVNPSIVYTVNKRSRVLSVRAANDEAAETVSALETEGIRFLPVAEAIDKTMALFEKEGYLDAEQEDYVLMNVSADDAGIREKVTAEVETGMEQALERDPTMEYRVDHSDRAMANRASDKGMSTGRYAVWEQEGAGRAPEEFAEMPVRELLGKPEKTEPQSGEDASSPQMDKDVVGAPVEGTLAPQGISEKPEEQPSAMSEAGSGSGQPEESKVPSAAPDQPSAMTAQPSTAASDMPGEPAKSNSMQPEGGQTAPVGEPASESAPSDTRPEGDRQNGSAPRNEGQPGGMTQGAPGNAQEGPGR